MVSEYYVKKITCLAIWKGTKFKYWKNSWLKISVVTHDWGESKSVSTSYRIFTESLPGSKFSVLFMTN